MSDNQRLEYLLHLYLQQKITLAEAEELRLMIKSGLYDNEIKDIIEAELFLESGEMDLSPSRAQALLDKIFTAESQAEAILPKMSSSRWRITRWLAPATLLLLVVGWFWMRRSRDEKSLAVNNANYDSAQKSDSSRRNFPVTGARMMQLPDGSTVLLNENSHLAYLNDFKGNSREVSLEGEGYFNIKHDARHPFIVHTGRILTTVLGTAFNIRAYKGQNDIRVTVTRGKVQVENEKKILGTVTPNQQLAVNPLTDSYHLSRVEAEQEIKWKEQLLVLENISLGDAAVLIGNKFHVRIFFSNEAVRRCHISASFSVNESLEHVLGVICGVTGSSYTQQPNDEVVIDGNGCD